MSGFGLDRVLYSNDGGHIWINISNGLPGLPVHSIRYLQGSNDMLFAGTDAGVYRRTALMNAWEPFNNNLPSPIISDIEINDSLQVIRVSTFGRGIWESPLQCDFVNDTLKITRDTIWRTQIKMDRSILVKAPAHFTIKNLVRFPYQAKIMVEPGAQLIVDGGTLSNGCGSQWLGIDVWGNSSKPQNSVNQGWVYFRNGAIVEHARIGVSTCKVDVNGNIIWNTTGGIITATNCTFLNNYKAIQFLSYPYRQYSKFENVAFQSDGGELNDINHSQLEFVSLFDVYGVRFSGCRFQNLNIDTTLFYHYNSVKRYGIYSINAAFSIGQLCLSQTVPCSQLLSSKFSGLNYTVYAENYNPLRFVEINKCYFSNNFRGVYFSGMIGASLTSNTFKIPRVNATLTDTLYNLYLNTCSRYKVQENSFTSKSYYPYYYNANFIGLIVNNSGIESNEIYNNQFSILKYAILAQDQNRSTTSTDGLCLKCNDFSFTKFDAAIPINDPSHYSDWGIALYQGDSLSVTGPAGNTFSPQHTSGVSDLNNLGARFKYYHHTEQLMDPRLQPDYYTNVAVRPTIWTYTKPTGCPSKLVGGGSISGIKDAMAYESDTIIAKELQLSALIDGGNTESLNSEILTSTPSEAVVLRDQLISKSPFLSDTTMQSAIAKENVLPNEMIRDVLVANPQSATSDKVLEELNSRFVPMPDSMMAEIMVGEEIVSTKEMLEAEIASHKNKRAEALNDLIRIYRNDTVNPSSHDSLIALFQNQPDLPLKYLLAFEYLNTRDTNSLNNTLAAIPSSFNLNPQQSNAHNDYLAYFLIMKSMVRNDKNIFTMDSSSIAVVQNIYNTGLEPVKTYARNILIIREALTYHEPILLPDNVKSSKEKKIIKMGRFVEKSYMKVFPNPAKQYLIVEYNLKDKFNNKNEVTLIVTNTNGHNMLQKILIKRQDQELIPTTTFSTGTYLCSISVNGKILDTKKFVIVE